jgi:DNA polymerase-3 subunit alpha
MVLGRDIALNELVDPTAERYSEAAEFREIIETDEDSQKVFDLAKGLEGLKRQWGVHAAGVIMSAEPLMDVIPIMKREEDGAIITQFDQPPCESLGLLKMDFLGLRNLTMLDDALFNIKLNRNETVVLEELDLNADEKTFELLSRGDTLGVFQLDGDSMRQLLRLLKPSEFEHISAVIALYRPGPMGMNSHINYAQRKNGLQESEGVHPELMEPLSEILDPTYGLIVYQEQVMSAAQKVAGYTLGQADLLRRAMGKKKPEELDKQLEVFRSGMKGNGFSDGAIKALWDTLLPFADYAFNKAHSAGYAVLSYWTAYLKANFPAEYMAALLTSVGDSKDKLAVYLNECRRMGIQVLPPDVNQSISGFAAVGNDIRFGLNAIRNVGKNVVDAIVEARAESPFDSFQDYLTRVASQAATKRCVESLIKAGAFDSLGHTRRSLIAVHEEAIDASAVLKKQALSGQVDLFGGMFDEDPAMVPIPNLPEWTKRDLLAHEREMLGLYVSDHPLAGQEALLMRHSDMGTFALKDSEIGLRICADDLGGMGFPHALGAARAGISEGSRCLDPLAHAGRGHTGFSGRRNRFFAKGRCPGPAHAFASVFADGAATGQTRRTAARRHQGGDCGATQRRQKLIAQCSGGGRVGHRHAHCRHHPRRGAANHPDRRRASACY